MSALLEKILSFHRFSPYHYPRWRFSPTLPPRIDRVVPCYLAWRPIPVSILLCALVLLLLGLALYYLVTPYPYNDLLSPHLTGINRGVLGPFIALLVVLILVWVVVPALHAWHITTTLKQIQGQKNTQRVINQLSGLSPTAKPGSPNLGIGEHIALCLRPIYQACCKGEPGSYFCTLAAMGLAENHMTHRSLSTTGLDPRWFTLYRQSNMSSLNSTLKQIETICRDIATQRVDEALIRAIGGSDFYRIWCYSYPYIYLEREIAQSCDQHYPGNSGDTPLSQASSSPSDPIFCEYFEYFMMRWFSHSIALNWLVSYDQFHDYQQQINQQLQIIHPPDQLPIIEYVILVQGQVLGSNRALERLIHQPQR